MLGQGYIRDVSHVDYPQIENTNTRAIALKHTRPTVESLRVSLLGLKSYLPLVIRGPFLGPRHPRPARLCPTVARALSLSDAVRPTSSRSVAFSPFSHREREKDSYIPATGFGLGSECYTSDGLNEPFHCVLLLLLTHRSSMDACSRKRWMEVGSALFWPGHRSCGVVVFSRAQSVHRLVSYARAHTKLEKMGWRLQRMLATSQHPTCRMGKECQ